MIRPDGKEVDLLIEPEPSGHPAGDLALSHALLRLTSDGKLDHVLRIHRPSVPMVVFGRRDTRLPGFPAALEAVREEGFTPAIRAAGGRVVAYTPASLVIDEVRREPGAVRSQESRFEEFGNRFVTLFRELGVDARVGAVPGEYCPGAHSVNARGTRKLVGTAQRILRDAWLFSSLVVVDDQEQVREVLTRVHRELDLPFAGESVGSLVEENRDLSTDIVEQAARAQWGVTGSLAPPVELLELAGSLLPDHLA